MKPAKKKHKPSHKVIRNWRRRPRPSKSMNPDHLFKPKTFNEMKRAIVANTVDVNKLTPPTLYNVDNFEYMNLLEDNNPYHEWFEMSVEERRHYITHSIEHTILPR